MEEFDFEEIIGKIIEVIKTDMELCKYIKYNVGLPLDEPDFDPNSIIRSYINLTPKVPIAEGSSSNFLNIYVDDYVPSNRNRGFSGLVIEIDVLCNLNNWILDDSGIRPYRICSRLKSIIESANISQAFSLVEMIEMKKYVFSDNYHGYKTWFALSTKR